MIKTIVSDIQELKKKSEEIKDGENIDAIIVDLKDTLATKKGYGLAGNQIGINKRVAFYKINDKENVLINPRLIEKSEKIIFEESCLSFSGLVIKTDRYKNITFESNKQVFSAYGIEAIIIQHEIDHTNGLTIFDRKHKNR